MSYLLHYSLPLPTLTELSRFFDVKLKFSVVNFFLTQIVDLAYCAHIITHS